MQRSFHICFLLFSLVFLGIWKGIGSHSTHSSSTMSMVGGVSDNLENSAETVELAKYAVDEHNKKTNGALAFEHLVSARKQVVAGTLNHLTLQASGKVYEAKVWEKPWENFRSLEGFAPAGTEQADLTPAAPVSNGESVASPVLAGGVVDVSAENSDVKTELAQFAVAEHNKKTNSALSFERLVSAKQQVVQGTLHILRIQASGQLYDAKIWEKTWENSKSLEEFTAVESAQPSITSADLGTVLGGQPHTLTGTGPVTPTANLETDSHVEKSKGGFTSCFKGLFSRKSFKGENQQGEPSEKENGLREVDPSDPAVQEASEVALGYLQQSSNSLVPYTLSKVSSAHAEVGDGTTFYLDLVVSRGGKEESVTSKVHHSAEGKWSRK
eukprot:TRINITY_DN4763_c0_g1_i1.p1 TRINITY_DN4763_c0_g1~~TRINITY_DN4763_c0_g1_i1.p1  ORF type:complete len:384 (-),score=80.57 TRINITY_DN4763_c0_g1_i1:381-1532(-)